jgi:hypothetical protein
VSLLGAVAVLLLAVVALAVVQTLRHEKKVRAAFRDAIEREVRSLVPGEKVKLVGTAVPVGQPLEAPIGGTPCVFYEVTPTADDQVGRRRQDFYLEDATGRVLVEVGSAEVLLANLGDVIAPGDGGQMVEQGYIAVGALVAVVGHVELEPSVDETAGAFRERPRALRIKATLVAADPARLG